MMVETLCENRANLLRSAKSYHERSTQDLAGGRILLYAPADNLFDGAAQYASKGFFDVNNTPPWDTWMAFEDKYLVSWVPPLLVDLVDAGINVNPEQCIMWADEISQERFLKQSG